MAVLKSGNTTIEVRYSCVSSSLVDDYPDESLTILEVELRHLKHWVIQPGLVSSRQHSFKNPRPNPGTFYIAEPPTNEQRLIQVLQDALEKNEIAFYQSLVGFVNFYFYPPNIDFPPYRQSFSPRIPPEQSDPNDYFTVYIEFFDQGPEGTSLSFGISMEVVRYELQDFLDDLKADWSRFRERFPPEPITDKYPPLALDLSPHFVEFYLYQSPNTFGWIDIHIQIDGADWLLQASSTFPPFDNLLNFFTDIAENRLPSFCEVDEEGRWKYIHARPWETPGLLHLELIEDGYPHFKPLFSYLVDRRTLVQTFYDHFIEFHETHVDVNKWAFSGGLFKPESLTKLKQAIEKMSGTNPIVQEK
jgi:hypothetical protein